MFRITAKEKRIILNRRKIKSGKANPESIARELIKKYKNEVPVSAIDQAITEYGLNADDDMPDVMDAIEGYGGEIVKAAYTGNYMIGDERAHDYIVNSLERYIEVIDGFLDEIEGEKFKSILRKAYPSHSGEIMRRLDIGANKLRTGMDDWSKTHYSLTD